jgi:hypothetical protein
MIAKIRNLSTKQVGAAIAVAAVTGVVGATSLTNAAPAWKPTKEQCQQQGYKNYGQCVSEAAKNKSGYGG